MPMKRNLGISEDPYKERGGEKCELIVKTYLPFRQNINSEKKWGSLLEMPYVLPITINLKISRDPDKERRGGATAAVPATVAAAPLAPSPALGLVAALAAAELLINSKSILFTILSKH